MTITSEQELALNRAIAEFEGHEVAGIEDDRIMVATFHSRHRGYVTRDMAMDAGEPEMEGMSLGEDDDWEFNAISLYTRDLNAIVDVVRRWCENDGVNRALLSSNLGYSTVGLFIASNQPALALCLAFAKAAGLEWEKEK